MKKKILGIDLRGNSVKVVEISKNSKGIVLEKWGEGHIPPASNAKSSEKEKAQSKELRGILSKRLIRTKRAVVIISGTDILVKRITLPNMPHAELSQAMRLQVEKLISYPYDEAIFSFYRNPGLLSPEKNIKEESNELANYVLAIAKRESILQVMGICKKAHVNVISISVTPLALQTVFSDMLTPDITSIINVGQTSTTVSIYRDKEFIFNREIGIGGHAITQAMAGTVSSPKGKIELKIEDAELLKIKEGIPFDIDEYTLRVWIPGAELYAMIRPVIEKIEAEILRSFEYFGSPVTKIILTGGSSETRGFIEILSAAIKINCEKGKPNIITRHPDIPVSPYSVAIGAAMEEGKKINLMSEEDRHPLTNLINKAFNYWSAGFICGFIFVGLFILFFYQNITVTNDLSAVNRDAARFGVNLSGNEASPKGTYSFLDKFNSPGQKDVLIKILDEFSRILPENVSLNNIKYDSSSRIIIISGLFKKSKESDNITLFMHNLRKGTLFSAVDLSSLRESPSSRVLAYEFEMKCTIAGVSTK